MTVTNLTNTSWIIDISNLERPSDYDWTSVSINGWLGEDHYNGISGFNYYDNGSYGMVLQMVLNTEIFVFYSFANDTWYVDDGTPVPITNPEDLYVEFTGGTDVANQDFIDWLLDDAERVGGPVSVGYNNVLKEGLWADDSENGYWLETAGKIMADDVYVGVDYTKIPLETLTITANGTYTPQSGLGFSSVVASVPSSGSPTFTNISTATTNLSGAYVTSGSTDYYVKSVAVNGTSRDRKTLLVSAGTYGTVEVGTNVTAVQGTVTINGGGEKGVTVGANRLVVVDGQTVTYTATTTVTVGSGEQVYSAGDLKVPVYSPTSSALVFPSGFATATSTTTMTVTGQITSINGAQIKDTSSNIVKGSSTLSSTATYTSYLAKFTGANTVAAGPKVEITTVTPTSTVGYRNGDIVFVVQ